MEGQPTTTASRGKKDSSVEKAPEGWKINYNLAEELGVSPTPLRKKAITYEEDHPEWFRDYRTVKGHVSEHYHPELVSILIKEIFEYPEAPDDWYNTVTLARKLGRSQGSLYKNKALNRLRLEKPEWFKMFRLHKGSMDVNEFFSPDLVDELKKEIELGIEAPTGWLTNDGLARKLRRSYITVSNIVDELRNEYSDEIKQFLHRGRLREHYSPKLISKIQERFGSIEPAPEGWLSNYALSMMTKVGEPITKEIADRFRKTNPEWFNIFRVTNGHNREHYSPELVNLIEQEIRSKKEVAPEGWLTNKELAESLGISFSVIKRIADIYRENNHEWFKDYCSKSGATREYFSPELISLIRHDFESEKNGINVSETENKLEEFLENIEQTAEGAEFKKLVGLFGTSKVLDILYATHPSFKAVPVERIKSLIAEYLGDFTLQGMPFSTDGLEGNLDYLKIESLKSGLIEVVKDHCLISFLKTKKSCPTYSDKRIFSDYFFELEKKAKGLKNQELNDVILQVSEYYFSILEVPKSDNIVDSVMEGRSFPDIYQRINIREVGNKKRLLIADEMGVGKSASAILSKEFLDLKTALVVAPSNVIDTWKNYLSDNVDPDGKQRGYFKPGNAPRVLVVENIEDIIGVKSSEYDYILISQERLSDGYAKALKEIPYDMLIVDEIHRFKNIAYAKRPEKLLELAKKVEAEDKYLVMLSGTPVPNKIEDVALLLKLLHPDRFRSMDPKTLVSSILNGNLSDIRSLLAPYMQRKDLRDHVEMPELTEEINYVSLNGMEEDVYQVLLDEDELGPTQKISLLRRFLLNPLSLEITPNLRVSKIEALKERLGSAFETKNKIVMFVNDYIEGIVRGDGSIISGLGLDPGIEVRYVHGEVPTEERLAIQKEFNSKNGKKILLVVSGQTAGVGVDYTGGEETIFYNEPWTKAEFDQQRARVYRPGLDHDLISSTIITKGTIEEGIHRYVDIKQRAINKLLNGIPITEFEKDLLEKSEKSNGESLEVSPELAEYYFSSFDKMNKIFASVKEIGEDKFRKFLDRHGAEYADCYTELGSRSYQANASRVCATLINQLIRNAGKTASKVQIIDVASGPEMLRRHSDESLQGQITSVDLNINHFIAKGTKNALIGSFTDIPVSDSSFDFANLSLAFHYSKFLPSRGEFERADILKEMNRVLKVGGQVLINMLYTVDIKDMDKFKDIVKLFGFKVIEQYSGEINENENYSSRVIVLEKERGVNGSSKEIIQNLTRQDFDGLKLYKTERGMKKDSRKVLESFELQGRRFKIGFNENDEELVREEKSVLSEGEALRDKFGSIKAIPTEEIIAHDFVRVLISKKYVLFKKLSQGGVILVREESRK